MLIWLSNHGFVGAKKMVDIISCRNGIHNLVQMPTAMKCFLHFDDDWLNVPDCLCGDTCQHLMEGSLGVVARSLLDDEEVEYPDVYVEVTGIKWASQEIGRDQY